MPRCGCTGTCSCLIVAGEGVVVEGIGSVENPYQISSDAADLVTRVEFTDTSTIDFTTTGLGSGASPMVVSAVARVGTDELTDVQGTPDNSQVLVWVDDHWEPQDLPVALPPGGTTGQVLAKVDDTDGNAAWTDPGATAFQVQDTPTLDLSLTGSGSLAAPYVLSGTVLGGSGVVGERVYAASRTCTSGPSITNNVATKINYDTLERSDGVAWDATNLGFVIPVSGWYDVSVAHQFAANATGYRIAYIMVNGVAVATAAETGMTTGGGQSAQVVKSLYANAGDIVSGAVLHLAGAALSLTASGVYNYISIVKSPSVFPQSVALGERNYSIAYRQTSGQSIPSGTNGTPVLWDALDWSEGGITYDGAGNFTVPVAGYYQVNTKVNWPANATGRRRIRIGLDGSSGLQGIKTDVAVSGTDGQVYGFSKLLKCNAGSVINVGVDHTAGVNLAIGSYTSVDITKVPAPVVAGSAASGVWGTAPLAAPYGSDSLVGSEVYVDSRSQLRAKPNWFANAGSGIVDATTPVTAYPYGMSSMYLNSTDTAPGTGWPVEGGFWYIITQRQSTGAVQIATRLTTGSSGVYTEIQIRSGNESGGWQPWVKGMGIDTGWVPITWSASGWTLSLAPAIRRIGRTVFIRGRVTNASYVSSGHGVVGSLPNLASNVPGQAMLFPIACYGTTAMNRSFQISTNGDVGIASSIASSNLMDLYASYVVADSVI